jgi:ribosomal protein S18 acetylase RimI-like enzyme
MASLRELPSSDIERIRDIDRSERIDQQYRLRDGRLEIVDVDIDAAPWDTPGREHPVEQYIDEWRSLLDDGVLFGAIDGDRLVAFAIYRPRIADGLANLAVLHVSREHRRSGLGRRLTEKVVRRARADGARRLYVSATPTRGTVDFYMRQGFEVAAMPDPHMFELEPDDIHLVMNL